MFYGLGGSLTHLLLNDNHLDDISVDFKSLQELTHLDLNENPIETFPPFILPQKLQSFSLSVTFVSRLPHDTFFGVRGLQYVRISDNAKLGFIHPAAFDRNGKDIHTVDFSNNLLSNLSQTTLDWEKITELDLSGNAWDCGCELAWAKAIPIIAQQME